MVKVGFRSTVKLLPSYISLLYKHKMIEDGKSRIQVNGKTFTILHLFVIQTQDDRRW
jgi:hypothetical protein